MMSVTQAETDLQATRATPDSTGTRRARHTAKGQLPASPLRRAARFAGQVFTAVMFLGMAVLVFFLLQSRLAGGTPAVAGYQVYVVLGGSMEPAIARGGIVLVRPLEADAVAVGDIITYREADPAKEGVITTHRVMAINSTQPPSFVTRGDANEDYDTLPVQAGSLIGRVYYTVPYLGFFLSFVNTGAGLVLMVLIPGVLIIVSEVRNLFGYAHALEEEKRLKGGDVPSA